MYSWLIIQGEKNVKDSDVARQLFFCTERVRKLHNVVGFHIWLEDAHWQSPKGQQKWARLHLLLTAFRLKPPSNPLPEEP